MGLDLTLKSQATVPLQLPHTSIIDAVNQASGLGSVYNSPGSVCTATALLATDVNLSLLVR